MENVEQQVLVMIEVTKVVGSKILEEDGVLKMEG